MTAAATLLYHPEAYSTKGPKLMGRHMAGESFLRGWLMHAAQAPWSFQLMEAEHRRSLEQQLAPWLPKGAQVELHQAQSPQSLARSGALFRPGPGLAAGAHHRGWLGASHHSLVGITHTLSSQLAMDEVCSMVSADVQDWDALICTSRVAREVVQSLLEQQEEQLRDRLGATRFTRPQLPIIPLGVHTQDFQFSEATRAESRQALGLEPSDVAVLFAGRLSFHAKAHPLVLYQALHRAQRRLPHHRLVLLEFGQFPNQAIAEAFQAAAAHAAPGLRVMHLDGKSDQAWTRAWSAADLFCSLSDNIQETFGITPVEAMAAGLPVIASDWNGYKDTVVHGEVGLRVPSYAPAPGLGQDLANRHAWGMDNYDYYCGHVAAFTVIDPQALEDALVALAETPDTRLRLGAQARLRAQSHYDWSVIIPQYLALFHELSERRRGAGTKTPSSRAALDPYALFRSYPTEAWGPETELVLGPVPAQELPSLHALAMVSFAQAVMPALEDAKQLLEGLSHEPQTLAQLTAQAPAEHRARRMRDLLWLAKLGLVRRRASRKGVQPLQG